MDKLAELNRADDDRAAWLLEPLIERAPAIARKVAARRPFQDAEQLCNAIRNELFSLNEAERLQLFRAHPELAPDNPLSMTQASQSEQGRLNLTSGPDAIRARLDDLNARYRNKFAFPFITALVRHEDIESVLSEFEERLTADSETEIERAIDQVAIVSSSRVNAMFGCGKADRANEAAAENEAGQPDGT